MKEFSEQSRVSTVERLLGLVTEVRAGEGPTALMLSLNAFLLLASYACIKPVREAFILNVPGGAEYKVYMAAATAAVTLIFVPIYAKVAVKLPRNRLILTVTAFFASNLATFYILGAIFGSTKALALAFYLWIGVFNMMAVAQFWSFANDIYAEEIGKRLFPLLGLGGSIGATVGAAIAKLLIRPIGPLALLLVAAAALLCSGAVVEIVHRREIRRLEAGSHTTSASQPLGGSAGDAFKLILKSRYLGLIAVFSLLFTMVKTDGDYILAKLVANAAHTAVSMGQISTQGAEQYIGGIYANYDLFVNALSLILQAFVVSRLVKHAGLRFAFLILPVLAILDAATMAALPFIAIVGAGKVLESATDYSLNNTVRAMLWLPTTRRAKYLAKQAVDTFFVRMGDGFSALLVFVGVALLGWKVQTLALFNLLLAVLWIWLAWEIVNEAGEPRHANPQTDKKRRPLKGRDLVQARPSEPKKVDVQ